MFSGRQYTTAVGAKGATQTFPQTCFARTMAAK